MQAYLSAASFAFYRLNGYKHFPEYFFNFVRFYVIIHQKIDLKCSSTYRCPFYWESEAFICWTNREKNYHKIAWIAEIATSQVVADRKGRFHRGKNRKNCYAVNWSQHWCAICVQYQSSFAPKLARKCRKCEIEHWFPCGADGRAGGVRSCDYQIFWDGWGWVDLLTHDAPLLVSTTFVTRR